MYFGHSHPEGSRTYQVLSRNACLQHRILGCVKRNTVRQPLALPHQSGICENHKMLLQKAVKMKVTWCLGPRQPCGCNLDGSISNICCTPLTLHQSYFHLFGPLKKHLGCDRFQNVAKVMEAVLQSFHSQSPKVCAEHIYSLITHGYKCTNLHGDCMEKQVTVLFSHKKCYL